MLALSMLRNYLFIYSFALQTNSALKFNFAYDLGVHSALNFDAGIRAVLAFTTPSETRCFGDKTLVRSTVDNRALNHVINEFFNNVVQQNRNISSLAYKSEIMHKYLNANLRYLDHIHVLSILYRCAKTNYDFEHILDWPTASSVLNNPKATYNLQSLASSLYILSHDKFFEKPFMLEYLDIIENKLSHVRDKYLSGQAIGMSLYGLKHFSCTSNLLNILSSVTRLIQGSPQHVSKNSTYHSFQECGGVYGNLLLSFP